ncbi:sulfatase family protein [Alteromonas confluentis]|uniref:Sulfatase n=1 Tax=Alteromonas confluentis TaxID=1656094 RepID=A0A1E7Z9A1_9ALTE|nr:sulfatase [Alteromonas confluentis]OFC70108.1 sulfatase [Alteromonas confluentis]
MRKDVSAVFLTVQLMLVTSCGSGEDSIRDPVAPQPVPPPSTPTYDYPRVNDGEDMPNVLFIMADDHAISAISAYGNSVVPTPNIDRIAAEGVTFSNAFVTNSLCSPSRAVMLTGKMSHINGVRGNADVFDGSQQTLPKILQQNGYETAIFGKWHLKSEPTGFDYWEVLPGQGRYYKPNFLTPEGRVTEDGYVTDVITDKTLAYLSEKRDKDKPFFLMYQHKAPHRQWWPAMEELSSLTDKVFEEPDTLFYDQSGRGTAAMSAEMTIAQHMALSMDNKVWPRNLPADYSEFLSYAEQEFRDNYVLLTDEQKDRWNAVYQPINDDFMVNPRTERELTQWKFQRYMQDYTAVIKSVDRNVGRVLDYLDESGLAQNTIVVYTSDQGFYLGEFGWFDKRFMYEPSFRTPLLMRWPEKITNPHSIKSFVQNVDFAPMILSALGINVPEDMQGVNAMRVVEQEPDDWVNEAYYHYYDYPAIHMVKKHYGIRTERYKLIHFYDDIDEWELYDLERDPKEINNVFEEPRYSEVLKNIKDTLYRKKEQFEKYEVY